MNTMTPKTHWISRLAEWVKVKRYTDTDADFYANKDTRPLPHSRRPYGPWHFVGLWMVTASFNQSMLAMQSMLAIVVAHKFVGFVCIASGHPSAKWRMGFLMWMK
ncbi:hypothetical protein AAE478_009022 [Parahypoxylon ruwenzoriense]